MKLDRLVSGASIGLLSAAAVALACGCSTTSSTPAPRTTASATAPVSNVSGTTNLMSAEIPGPAPRVGKAHLAVDDSDIESGATGNVLSEENTPKEARRSDGSRRGGGFGSTK